MSETIKVHKLNRSRFWLSDTPCQLTADRSRPYLTYTAYHHGSAKKYIRRKSGNY